MSAAFHLGGWGMYPTSVMGLVLLGAVVFPGVVATVHIDRPRSIRLMDHHFLIVFGNCGSQRHTVHIS